MKKKVVLSILLFLFIVTIIITVNHNYQLKLNIERKKVYESAISYCSKLYNNNTVNDTVTRSDINKCISKLDKVYDKNIIVKEKNDAIEAKYYLKMNMKIDSYYKDGVVASDITLDDIDMLVKENEYCSDNYKSLINNRIEDLKTELEKINNIKNSVRNLFSDYDNNQVGNVDRNNYNSVIELVESLKQEDLKTVLLNKMNIVLSYVEEQEKIAYEKKRIEDEKRRLEEEARKRLINESWTILNVPYISQNRNGVLNGCEAASMLMALQYKGYLTGMDLYTYATNMPKSDDPNTGFYLDIFGKNPVEIAHWIAPEPLVNYGISSSGYNNIVNITGSSLDSIASEIISGNPVIVYLTYAYNSPYSWNNGAPKNLHVQLAIGYNTVTNEFVIQDPWTRSSGDYQFTLSYNKINNLYSEVGYKAVVVR